MDKFQSTAAQRVAEAAVVSERLRTGHDPESVRVVVGEDTVVITVYGALSAAEIALGTDPLGAERVREFHRQLFAAGAADLRREIEGIVGVGVREASAEVPTVSDATCSVFTTGTVVQVFLLDRHVPAGMCSATEHTGQSTGRPSLVEPARGGRHGRDGKIRLF